MTIKSTNVVKAVTVQPAISEFEKRRQDAARRVTMELASRFAENGSNLAGRAAKILLQNSPLEENLQAGARKSAIELLIAARNEITAVINEIGE